MACDKDGGPGEDAGDALSRGMIQEGAVELWGSGGAHLDAILKNTIVACTQRPQNVKDNCLLTLASPSGEAAEATVVTTASTIFVVAVVVVVSDIPMMIYVGCCVSTELLGLSHITHTGAPLCTTASASGAFRWNDKRMPILNFSSDKRNMLLATQCEAKINL